MYFSKHSLLIPGMYGALRSCYYLSKVKEQPLYTDMVLLTGVNAIAQYSPLLFYSMYNDMCVFEKSIRGLPQEPRVPILFVYKEWDN